MGNLVATLLEGRHLSTRGRDAVNPGGHALLRRVSERASPRRPWPPRPGPWKQGAPSPCWPPATTSPGPPRNGRDLPWPRWPSCGGAWPCSTTCWAEVERQTDEVHGDDYQAARLGALLNGPHRRGARRPFAWRRRPRPSPSGAWSRRTISPDDLLASLRTAGAPGRGGDRRRLARAGPSPRPGDGRGRPTGRRAAGPSGAGGGPRRHRRSSRAHRDDPLGAVDELTRIESTLADVAGARAELARLGEATAAAARTLAELEGLLDEGRAAFDRSRAEIASPEGLLAPVDPDVLSRGPGLRPWLARLERLVSEGDVSRAGPGSSGGGRSPSRPWRWPARWPRPTPFRGADAKSCRGCCGRPGSRRGRWAAPRTRWCPSWRGRRHGHWPSPDLRPRSPPSRPCSRACASRPVERGRQLGVDAGRSCPRGPAPGGGRLGSGPAGGGAGMTDGSPCAFAGCGGSLDGGYCDTCGRTPGSRGGPPPASARRRSSAGRRPSARRRLLVCERRRLRGRRAVLRPASPAPDIVFSTDSAGRRARAGRGPPRWSAAGPGAHGWGSASSTSPPSPRAIPGGGHAGRPGSRGGAFAPSAAARSGAPATTGRDCRRDSAASAGPGSPSRLGSDPVTWSAASTRCSAPLPTAAWDGSTWP